MTALNINVNLDVMTESTTAVAGSQTPAGAGALTLTGTTVSPTTTCSGLRVGHKVTVSCAGADAARSFVVVGYDAEGGYISETVAGSNGSISTSTKYYNRVDSITVDAATAGAVTAGFADECVCEYIHTSEESTPLSLNVDVTGTINYTVQFSQDRVHNRTPVRTYNPDVSYSPTWTDCTDTNLVGATADKQGSMTTPVVGLRLKVSSYSTGAEARFRAVQAIGE